MINSQLTYNTTAFHKGENIGITPACLLVAMMVPKIEGTQITRKDWLGYPGYEIRCPVHDISSLVIDKG